MSEFLPQQNAAGPSGLRGQPRDAASSDSGLGNGITVGTLLRALRQHLLLFLTVTTMTLAAAAFLVLNSTPLYRAKAVLHKVTERRTLASGMESVPFEADRTVDPLLSMVQVLTSRSLLGQVVDTLGLQLESVALPATWWAPIARPQFSTLILRDVVVDPAASADTLSLQFFESGVVAVGYREQATAAYGRPLRIGSVRFTVPAAPSVSRAALAVSRRDVAIDRVLERLKVSPRVATDVIDVRYTDADPQLAQRVANTLALAFQATTGTSARQYARRRGEFLKEQVRVTDSLLSRAEGALSGFRSRQQMGSSSDNLAAEQATVGALDTRRGELEADRRVFSMLLDGLKDSAAAGSDESFRAIAYSPELASDPMIGRLHQQLIDHRARLDSLTAGPYPSTASNPDVLYVRELMGTTRGELIRAVEARMNWIAARIEVLGERRMRGAQLLQSLPSKQAEEDRLGRRVEVLRTTADALRQEFEKARISEALEAADVEVLDLAPLPYGKTGIPRSIQLGLGLLLGLVFGLAAAVLAEAMNRAVRRPEELPHALGAPELGLIPRISPTQSRSAQGRRLLVSGTGHGENSRLPAELVVTWPGSPSPEAEAFRTLRISLSFQWQDGPRTLVVTSAAPQEGKTLVAANLAATFARGGAHVLLVDCDIHRPRLHRVFRVSRSPGLMELLRPDSGPVLQEVSGPPAVPTYTFAPWLNRSEPVPAGITRGTTVEWHPAIRKTPVERLSLLPCGAVSSNASDLLEPSRLRDRLAELHKHFDIIVLDTPPVLVSADAATLAASADGVVMIVRAGRTDRGAADLAYQRLTAAGGRVLGAVLNDPDGVMSQISDKRYYAYDYPADPD